MLLLYQQEDDDEDEDDDDDEEQNIQHLAPQYKHLITIKAGKPKGGTTSDALKCDPDKVRRLSLSEQQLAKAVVNHGTEIVRYTSNEVAPITASHSFPSLIIRDPLLFTLTEVFNVYAPNKVYAEKPTEDIPKGHSGYFIQLQSFCWLGAWCSDGRLQYAGASLFLSNRSHCIGVALCSEYTIK